MIRIAGFAEVEIDALLRSQSGCRICLRQFWQERPDIWWSKLWSSIIKGFPVDFSHRGTIFWHVNNLKTKLWTMEFGFEHLNVVIGTSSNTDFNSSLAQAHASCRFVTEEVRWATLTSVFRVRIPSGKLTVCYWKWPFSWLIYPWKIVIFYI